MLRYLCKKLSLLLFMVTATVIPSWSQDGPSRVVATWAHGIGWKNGCTGRGSCYVTLPFGVSQRAVSWNEQVRQCTSDDRCKALIVSVAAYYGADPQATKLGLDAVDFGLSTLEGRDEGQAHYRDYRAPAGYKICAIYAKVVARNGDSKISASISSSHRWLHVYMVSPQRSFLNGSGTNIDALIQVLLLRDDLYPFRTGPGCMDDPDAAQGGETTRRGALVIWKYPPRAERGWYACRTYPCAGNGGVVRDIVRP